MERDARPLAIAFAGTVAGAFAATIACLGGDGIAAVGLLGMTCFCAVEFVHVAEAAPDS